MSNKSSKMFAHFLDFHIGLCYIAGKIAYIICKKFITNY